MCLNDDNVFPVLGDGSANIFHEKKSESNFVNAIITNDNNIKNVESIQDIKAGWTIIDKNDRTIKTYNNQGIIIDRKKTQEDLYNKLHQYEIYKINLDMCRRWCNYYDEINNLIGDRSPYINYKNEIRNIISEENDIMNKIYGDDYHSSSDDEREYNDDMNIY